MCDACTTRGVVSVKSPASARLMVHSTQTRKFGCSNSGKGKLSLIRPCAPTPLALKSDVHEVNVLLVKQKHVRRLFQ